MFGRSLVLVFLPVVATIYTDQGFVTQQRLDNISRDLATALADYQCVKAADAVKKSTTEIAAATAERGLADYNLSQASAPAPTGGSSRSRSGKAHIFKSATRCSSLSADPTCKPCERWPGNA